MAAAKEGDHLTSAALLTALLERGRRQHLTHKELHACCSNRAAALLQLGLHQPALEDAERAMTLLRHSFPGRCVPGSEHFCYVLYEFSRALQATGKLAM